MGLLRKNDDTTPTNWFDDGILMMTVCAVSFVAVGVTCICVNIIKVRVIGRRFAVLWHCSRTSISLRWVVRWRLPTVSNTRRTFV